MRYDKNICDCGVYNTYFESGGCRFRIGKTRELFRIKRDTINLYYLIEIDKMASILNNYQRIFIKDTYIMKHYITNIMYLICFINLKFDIC